MRITFWNAEAGSSVAISTMRMSLRTWRRLKDVRSWLLSGDTPVWSGRILTRSLQMPVAARQRPCCR